MCLALSQNLYYLQQLCILPHNMHYPVCQGALCCCTSKEACCAGIIFPVDRHCCDGNLQIKDAPFKNVQGFNAEIK